MRRGLATRAILAVGFSLVAGTPILRASAEVSGFTVSFLPPGLLLRGEDVTFSVFADSEQGEISPKGDLYVRGGLQTSFTRVHLSGDTSLTARVPAAALGGSVVESYVVVTDQNSGTSFTVPEAGPDEPDRSWIVDDPSTVELGKHRFGHIREPDAIVVDAAVGTGRGEIGIACPPDGPCDAPQSFDVAPDGSVWVADIHNSRLVSWVAGEPGKPGRTVPLDYAPADLAIAPDGTMYVWGPDPGVGMRIHAVAPDGAELWSAPTLSDIFNEHIRIEANGTPYLRTSRYGWIPVVDTNGEPFSLSEQRQGALRDQPASPDLRLVVTSSCILDTSCDNPRDARVALVDSSGDLRAEWIVKSDDVLVDEPEDVTPAVVAGDPVLISALYEFSKHLKEFEVLRLAADGSVADRFSLGRGVLNGDLAVTDVRVGSDGDIYQMQYDVSDPEAGMQIAHYALAGGPTPTPTETATPTPTPTTLSPTPPSASSAVSSPAGSARAAARRGLAPAAWIGISLGGLALVAGLVAALWLRRRRRPPAGNGGIGGGPDLGDGRAPG